MYCKNIRELFLAFIVTYVMNSSVCADTIPDPCAGSSPLLNIIDRPTVADSACVVPFKHVVLETGYEYQQLTHSAGHQQNYPEAEFRIGLPLHTEIAFLLPNYINQSMLPSSGFTATSVGIKHELVYTANWLATVDFLYTLPDGSSAFGSKGPGTALSGIFSYTFNPKLNLTIMLGASSETASSFNGGQRFTSINPIADLTYSITDNFDIYGEVYGQTKTAPSEGSGSNCDAGIIYLIKSYLAVDAEVGQRISGNLGGFNHYVGAGLSIMI